MVLVHVYLAHLFQYVDKVCRIAAWYTRYIRNLGGVGFLLRLFEHVD
jgi:hypothetical protein